MARELGADVLVAGGGSAGVAAAVGAARAGADVLLIERYPFLGGAGTMSGVHCFCGFFTSGDSPQRVVAGLGLEMLLRLQARDGSLPPFRAAGSRNTVVPFHPEVLKGVLDDLAVEARVRVRLHTWIVGAARAGGRLRGVDLWSKSGAERAAARVFVDCSGDGDLAALAGAEVAIGDDDGRLQSASMYFTLTGVDWSELSRLGRPDIGAIVARAHAEGWPHITPQPGLFVPLPGGEVLASFHKDPGVNGLDADSLTAGELAARRAVASYVRLFRERFPGCGAARLGRTGVQIGIRESRRVMGRYLLTGRECMEGVRFADAVARGGWPIELHDAQGQGRVYARYGHIRNDGYYHIPARSLIVHGLGNLLVAGRCLSASHGAQASARVMGTAWATGHAAGVLAALSADGRPREDAAWFADARRILEEQGALV